MNVGLPMLRLAALVAILGACVAGWRSASASASARLARTQAEGVAERLMEIQRLRPQRQTALLASRPTESISASVRSALAAAGMGDSTLRAVSSGADEPVHPATDDGPVYHRQSVAVNLVQITPRQLGQFLAAWRASEPAWIVVRIDLTHQGSESDSAYDARLSLATTYIASPASPPATQPQ
ncbi:MAG: hypothetical protein AABZ53_05220 [Planctomycetota bacterium]